MIVCSSRIVKQIRDYLGNYRNDTGDRQVKSVLLHQDNLKHGVAKSRHDAREKFLSDIVSNILHRRY